MIKAVIFDCFGVLTTDNWQKFLSSLPEEADLESAREAHRAYDKGLLSKQEAAEQIQAATGKSFTEIDDASNDEIVKNTPLLEYVRELHQEGYKTSILSNVASNWIREQLLTPDEQAYFDDFLLSHEVGLTKPDPRMFKLAAERLDIELQKAVLVDDKESYCTAARELGMQVVWYQDFKQMKAELKQLLADAKR
ncbi:MAG TPA: HAD family phosphatase [Verrucomicrobiae bacterium]|nr:HAD family phosphatase [Verrucomicrobiae bacterium]